MTWPQSLGGNVECLNALTWVLVSVSLCFTCDCAFFTSDIPNRPSRVRLGNCIFIGGHFCGSLCASLNHLLCYAVCEMSFTNTVEALK